MSETTKSKDFREEQELQPQEVGNPNIKRAVQKQEQETEGILDDYVSKKWYKGPLSSARDVKSKFQNLKEIHQRIKNDKDEEIRGLQAALEGDEVKKVAGPPLRVIDNAKKAIIVRKNIADGIIRIFVPAASTAGMIGLQRLPELNPIRYGKLVNAIHELQRVYNMELHDKNTTIRVLRQDLKEKNKERREMEKTKKKERKETAKRQKDDQKMEAKMRKLDKEKHDLIMKKLRRDKAGQGAQTTNFGKQSAANDTSNFDEEAPPEEPTQAAA